MYWLLLPLAATTLYFGLRAQASASMILWLSLTGIAIAAWVWLRYRSVFPSRRNDDHFTPLARDELKRRYLGRDVPDGADQPLAVEGLNKTFTGLDRVRHGLLDQRVHACLGEGEADLFMKLCGHYDHGGIDAVGDQLLN